MSEDPTPFEVEKPFDKLSGGDVILQSSDQVDFFAHRMILAMGSSVFEGMFGIPQPPPEKANCPVVAVTEDAETLNALLRCIYPIEKPSIQTIDLAVRLTFAADKYFVSASCLSPVYFCLKNAEVEPAPRERYLRYALGWRLGFKELTLQVSHEILQEPVEFIQHLPLMPEISGGVEAQVVLESAMGVREARMMDMSAMLNLRAARFTCDSCMMKEGKLLGLVSKVKLALESVIQHDWMNFKREELTGGQLSGCLHEAERAVVKGPQISSCVSCGNLLRNAMTSLPGMTLRSSFVMANAVTWPSNKPDNAR